MDTDTCVPAAVPAPAPASASRSGRVVDLAAIPWNIPWAMLDEFEARPFYTSRSSSCGASVTKASARGTGSSTAPAFATGCRISRSTWKTNRAAASVVLAGRLMRIPHRTEP